MTIRFHESLTPLMEPIAAVRQHPDNPNSGDVEIIAESMEVNGVFAPVIAQRSTGYILAGNHRYAALVSLGVHRIPVLWLDVDDRAADKIMLADNRTAAMAEMDLGLLDVILDRLLEQDAQLGLLGTGYDAAYLEDLHKALDPPVYTLPEDEGEEFDGVRQRGQTITCPSCGHEFGGGR